MLEAGVRLVMRVHTSNFKLIGFTSEPSLVEIVNLVHSYGGIVIDDLGSGSLLDTSPYGLGHEPMIQESIQAGADVVLTAGATQSNHCRLTAAGAAQLGLDCVLVL